MDETEVVDPLDQLDEVTEASEETPAETAEEVTEEKPRDELGRYAEKPEEGETTEEVEPEEAGETPAETDVQGFAYHADGQEYTVPGATRSADGILSIPADQVSQIQQLLSSGRHLSGGWSHKEADWQRQIDASKANEAAQTARAQGLIDEMERVAGLSPEAQLEWVEGVKAQWPTIKAQAEQAAAESKNKADSDRLVELEQQETERQREPMVRQELESLMTNYWQRYPELQALNQQQMTAVMDDLLSNRKQHGLLMDKDGRLEFNTQVVEQRLIYASQFVTKQEKAEANKAEAAKTNAAELGKTKAPPAVKTKTGPAPASKPPSRFTPSKDVSARDVTEEVDDYFDAMVID